MVRKYSKKTRSNRNIPTRTTSKTTSKKKSQLDNGRQHQSSASDLDYTLPDGNHLDSFDIIRSDNVLKASNVLKRDVRASFNRDSSIEIDSETSSSTFLFSTSSIVLISESRLHNKESITSENSYLFSKSDRATNEVRKSRENEGQSDLISYAWLNKNSDFPVSPLTQFLSPHNGQTSTPAICCKNVPKDHQNETCGSTTNIDNKSDAVRKTPTQLNYVAKRRPKVLQGKLIFSLDEESINEDDIVSISELKMTAESDSFEVSKPECDIDEHQMTANDNKSEFESLQIINDTNATIDSTSSSKNERFDTISVSSSSGYDKNGSIKLLSANASDTNDKTRVGFNTSNLIREIDDGSLLGSNTKVVMKGGKWRRTIFEIRKNKMTASPRQSTADQRCDQSIGRNSGHFLRRKSIFVKDIPDRMTLCKYRKSKSQNVSVLDESDVESICSSDFSPKSTPINVRSNQRSKRLQPLFESVGRERKQKSTLNSNNGSQLSLCASSSSVESILNELEHSTTSLHLGFNSVELRAQLLKRCGQSEVLPFDVVYSPNVLTKCQKIGEGVFGEVYLNETHVLKIIPIEGDVEINGAQQKRFDEILQEVIISQELSALRCGDKNRTAGFVEVLNVRLVEGRYPACLLDLWDDYDTRMVSENDRPDVFGDDQLYVVFELTNCGIDLEAHVFKNAEQAYSAFEQVALSLAVAELQFEFEHRDLHWGNILIAPCHETSLNFLVNGKPIEVRTHGVKATIIDYTLSRIVYKNCCLFQDLAADPELFEATGDYQYEIYRLMRAQTNNYWEVFVPYTNILWLHYTIDKMIGGVNYTAKRGVKHRQFIDKMIELRDEIQEYRSAADLIESNH